MGLESCAPGISGQAMRFLSRNTVSATTVFDYSPGVVSRGLGSFNRIGLWVCWAPALGAPPTVRGKDCVHPELVRHQQS